ncbi:MAG TPA: DUF4372 domain-containing protein [Verrucomicrobiae bacterium]|nr:DUF4372 domain-containing protein [Verrucomicrobiae bacterium]
MKGRNQKTSYKPTASKFSILRQLCNLIPPHLVPQLARDTGVEDHTRTFSPWSQAVSLLYARFVLSTWVTVSPKDMGYTWAHALETYLCDERTNDHDW